MVRAIGRCPRKPPGFALESWQSMQPRRTRGFTLDSNSAPISAIAWAGDGAAGTGDALAVGAGSGVFTSSSGAPPSTQAAMSSSWAWVRYAPFFGIVRWVTVTSLIREADA